MATVVFHTLGWDEQALVPAAEIATPPLEVDERVLFAQQKPASQSSVVVHEVTAAS